MIDRKKELDKLLEKLKGADTGSNSDVDLIFKYLETFLNDPSINKGGSKKLMEFQVQQDQVSASKIYNVSWRQFDYERF